MKTAPNYVIGTSKRVANANPGMKGVSTDPGAYDPKNTFTKLASPNYRMGSEQRKMFDDKRGKSVPGPGNYPIKSQAFEPNKGYAMGIKGKDMSKMAVPGAGAYDPQPESQKKKQPTYSMAVKLKSDMIKNTWVPGPGSYVQDNEKLKQSAPSFGFGSSTRPDIQNKKLNTPGPGSYHQPLSLAARWESVS